jgi:hypothetical protein
MLAVLAPVLQVIPVVGFALSTTVCPSQKLNVCAADITGAVGRGFIVTGTAADVGA